MALKCYTTSLCAVSPPKQPQTKPFVARKEGGFPLLPPPRSFEVAALSADG